MTLATNKVLITGPTADIVNQFSHYLDNHTDILCGPETNLFAHPNFWSGKADILDILNLPNTPLATDSGYSWARTASAGVQYYLSSIDQLKSLPKEQRNADAIFNWIFSPRLTLENKKISCDSSPCNIFSLNAAMKNSNSLKSIVLLGPPDELINRIIKQKLPPKLAILIWITFANIAVKTQEEFGQDRLLIVNLLNLQNNFSNEIEKCLKFLNVDLKQSISLLNSNRSLRPSTILSTERIDQKFLDDSTQLNRIQMDTLKYSRFKKNALHPFIGKTEPLHLRKICNSLDYNISYQFFDFFKKKSTIGKIDPNHKNRLYSFFANLEE